MCVWIWGGHCDAKRNSESLCTSYMVTGSRSKAYSHLKETRPDATLFSTRMQQHSVAWILHVPWCLLRACAKRRVISGRAKMRLIPQLDAAVKNKASGVINLCDNFDFVGKNLRARKQNR